MAARPKTADPRPAPRLYLVTPRLDEPAGFVPQLAAALADKSVALLRAHGMVAVGPSLPVAVFRAIFTVASAGIQHQAQALGGPIAALDPEEGRIADIVNVDTVGRSWDAWKQRVA